MFQRLNKNAAILQKISRRPLNAFVFTSKGMAVNLSMDKKAQFKLDEPGSETLSFKLLIDYTRVVEVIKLDLVRLSKQEYEDVKFVDVGRTYLKNRRTKFINDISNRAMAKTIIRSQHFSMDNSQLLMACGESFVESSKAVAKYDEKITKSAENNGNGGLRIVIDKESDHNDSVEQ